MKVYDPALCMMVEKPSVKTNDEKKTFIVNIYVDGKNVKFASSAMSANGAILEARKKYPQGLVWGVDRATAKDESIKTEDAAVDDFKKAIQMVEQIRQITRKYARNIDANAIFAYCDKIQDKYQYYVDNAHRGWYG